MGAFKIFPRTTKPERLRFTYSADSSLYKSWFPEVRWGHNGGKLFLHVFILGKKPSRADST
jgi:hypothetical protein